MVLTEFGRTVLLTYSIVVIVYMMMSLVFSKDGIRSLKVALEVALLIPVFIFLTNL